VTGHEELVARLEGSRAALVAALSERTEQDFAHALGGEYGEQTLGQALAALANAERADLASARGEPAPRREVPEKPLPPQVTHDLAGARHQTLTHLGEVDAEAAAALVEGIVGRERLLVDRIGETVDAS
jgi:hypothetical protein